ncbi:MAG: agmatinase [Gammaproteobacteria bacterium]|nr:agmatinase [Gammaproteobacteria bacterium]
MSDDTKKFSPIDASVMPRFGGMPTFMRLPHVTDPALVDIALIGVPWDAGTTNRAGARHGPREIRNQSSFMRAVHHVSRIAPYELCNVADLGDVEVNPFDIPDAMDKITAFFRDVIDAGAVPLAVGGDHLCTLPILRAVAKDGPVGLIHFDAHSDTNDSYFGGNKYTHGTPFRRAVEEGLIDPLRVIQIGIRGSIYGADDMAFAEETGMRVIYIEEFFEIGSENVIKEIHRVIGDAPAYVTFDVDGIDPAFTPGTGTPEIGGYNTYDAQMMLRGLQGLNLVGGDVVEVAPPFDPSGTTALVGATLMFEILCVLADAHARAAKR